MTNVIEQDLSNDAPAAPDTPAATVFEAIARHLCVRAVYNGATVQIAPHIVYTKREGLFVDAVTLERDGNPPKEIKIGAFKLIGLRNIALTSKSFLPHRGFDSNDPKYSGNIIFAL